VVDADGRISRRDVVASDPDVLARWLNGIVRSRPGRAGNGASFDVSTTVWSNAVLLSSASARDTPKGACRARVNKSDVHDAEGLAQLARTGWAGARVHMKGSATHIDERPCASAAS
jgi:transposase